MYRLFNFRMISEMLPTRYVPILVLILTSPQFASAQIEEVPSFDSFQECSICPEMVVLPLGSFVMGAPLEQSAELYLDYLFPLAKWANPDLEPRDPPGMIEEGPEHEVEVDIPIAMGRYEVTVAQWMACVEAGGCTDNPRMHVPGHADYVVADNPDHPVTGVSFLDMQDYIAWLNRGLGTTTYRLPTEAEWEYAARAGTGTTYFEGETLTREQANILLFIHPSKQAPGNRRMPVDVMAMNTANAWGLHHMAGNAGEVTLSCFAGSHLGFETSSAYLAHARNAGECDRVWKGGSFGADAVYARPAYRRAVGEARQHPNNGFRLVKEMRE